MATMLGHAKPRDWATLAVAAAGAAVAGYLTYSHYAPGSLYCTVGDCKTVQNSDYAMLGPIPIAVLGLGMFLTVIAVALWRLRQPAREFEATAALFAMTLIGVIYFAWLTYIEVAVLNAICQWCVAASIMTLGIFVAETRRLWHAVGMSPAEGVAD